MADIKTIPQLMAETREVMGDQKVITDWLADCRKKINAELVRLGHEPYCGVLSLKNNQ